MTELHAPLSSVAWIRAGYQSRSTVEESPDGSHALVQLRDFSADRGSLDVSGVARIQPGGINPEQILQEGDVLFLAKGLRNFAFVPELLPSPSLAASYFFIIRPERRILPHYLAWFLNLGSTKKRFSRLSGYSAHMPVVRRDVLEQTLIPLPDLATQQKIVALADLAVRQEKLLVELAEKKKALATAACLYAAGQPST
jgi:hypothetical protein